jgi:hypothetical protein
MLLNRLDSLKELGFQVLDAHFIGGRAVLLFIQKELRLGNCKL